MMSSTDMVSTSGPTEQSTVVTGNKENAQVMASAPILMEAATKETSSIILSMAKVSLNTRMVLHTLETGKMTSRTAAVFSHGLMVTSSQANG